MIETITISKGIEEIGNMTFMHSQALNEVIIPATVKTIGAQAFFNCILLADIVIPSSVTTMSNYAFSSIPSITVHVPWKEGEKPEGWADAWNYPDSPDYTITVDYAK